MTVHEIRTERTCWVSADVDGKAQLWQGRGLHNITEGEHGKGLGIEPSRVSVLWTRSDDEPWRLQKVKVTGARVGQSSTGVGQIQWLPYALDTAPDWVQKFVAASEKERDR